MLARALAADTRDDRHAKLAVRLRYALPAIQLGRETANALTFEMDQSPGAGHQRRDSLKVGLLEEFVADYKAATAR